MEKEKIELKTEDGGKLILEIIQNRLVFTKIEANGKTDRRDAVLDNDIVLLYEYILHQRQNDLELF